MCGYVLREVDVFGLWAVSDVVVGDAVVDWEMNAKKGRGEGGMCASVKDTLLLGPQKKKKKKVAYPVMM